MTKLEWQMTQDLWRCRFAPATFDKKFSRDMHARGKDYKLSERQRVALAKLHYKYRKQIEETKR